jgi:hypothetical protein
MNLERRDIDVIQAANVDCPSLRRESRPVKRMDPAVSTEVVRCSLGVELVGGQCVLARGDFELFYLRLLVERPFSPTHRAVTLCDRLDFGINLKSDAPAMAGSSVYRHNFLPAPDAKLIPESAFEKLPTRKTRIGGPVRCGAELGLVFLSASPLSNLAHPQVGIPRAIR